jgi:DNA-3-methyladenine glycosylase I
MKPLRCGWVNLSNPKYVEYHDHEWGKPIFTDERHAEYLLLETFQAGLSWETVLNKREAFQKALFHFDVHRLAKATKQEVGQWMQMPTLIRHEKKFIAAIENAKVFLIIQKTFVSFHAYLQTFTGKTILDHHPKKLSDLPASTPLSLRISDDLKKRGMRFVGPTIVYAHLQAMGMINDHLADCFTRQSNLD